MVNIIVIAIVLAIVGAASFYLYRAKKRGESCIGCPYAKQCGKKKRSPCGGCGSKESGK